MSEPALFCANHTADEIRFLRKYLGWSGVIFAKHMGV